MIEHFTSIIIIYINILNVQVAFFDYLVETVELKNQTHYANSTLGNITVKYQCQTNRSTQFKLRHYTVPASNSHY